MGEASDEDKAAFRVEAVARALAIEATEGEEGWLTWYGLADAAVRAVDTVDAAARRAATPTTTKRDA